MGSLQPAISCTIVESVALAMTLAIMGRVAIVGVVGLVISLANVGSHAIVGKLSIVAALFRKSCNHHQ